MLIQRALRSREVETENRQLHEQLNKKFGLESFVGTSLAMQEVFDTIKQVAPSRATVLIAGESGTGKELVAQAIHRLSPRAKSPFVAVHCAALSETLLESELFGHERGAFTGAAERRRGRFELADGGTLFLDEIGEIDPATQVKILRVLEERRFERVGGVETIDVDVRLIAATNRDLQQMVAKGTFRQDLFFRLDVVTITLPPLRERVGDIPLLVQHYLAEFAKENSKQIETITPDAMDLLTAYAWPGNVRELRNVLERMVVLCRADKLTVRDVPANIREGAPSGARVTLSPVKGGVLSIDDAERQLVVRALDLHKGNVTKAAKELGISRRTLHRKLNEYGLRGMG
jgi:DNA-binding NtrC family response regulator